MKNNEVFHRNRFQDMRQEDKPCKSKQVLGKPYKI